MTESDLAKIMFRFVSHVYTEHSRATVRESVDYEPRITLYMRTHVKDNGRFGSTIIHYIFNGNVYKTKKKFLEAVTAWEEENK